MRQLDYRSRPEKSEETPVRWLRQIVIGAACGFGAFTLFFLLMVAGAGQERPPGLVFILTAFHFPAFVMYRVLSGDWHYSEDVAFILFIMPMYWVMIGIGVRVGWVVLKRRRWRKRHGNLRE